MSTDIAAFKIEELRNEIARLKNQTNWVCKCGGTDCKGQRENAELRKDKERLDWLSTLTGSGWACLHLHRKDTIDGWLLTRNQIDRRMATEPKQ